MAAKQTVTLKPIDVRTLTVRIEGISPLIEHQWSEKALRQIREKHQGRKAKDREVRDPQAEAKAATYFTSKGEYGIPALALKSAIITAAHKDIGVEKTLVRKAVFIRCDDKNQVLPLIDYSEPVVREDKVRVGAGSADLRYRPEFQKWAVEFVAELDAELIQPQDFINLVNRAGFGVGICEWRPEKGGEFGRFRVAASESAKA